MRYGHILGRRLRELETLFAIPSPKQREDDLVVKALASMSFEDLDSLREIILLQNAGTLVEETPERIAVVSRWKIALEMSARRPETHIAD